MQVEERNINDGITFINQANMTSMQQSTFKSKKMSVHFFCIKCDDLKLIQVTLHREELQRKNT